MKYPKITVVTPNYNLGYCLEETILSVLDQNYPNLEYIIIDGGSTDDSLDIIKKYDDRLAYWVSEPDHGMYSAIQKGFDKSSGEIMAWLNSDDLYYPNALFTVAEVFSSFDEVQWLMGRPVKIDERSRTVEIKPIRSYTKFDYYDGFRKIQQESVFWRRQLWDKIGGSLDTTFHWAGDFDLWLRFFEFERIYFINTIIGGFRIRPDHASKKHAATILAEVEKSVLMHPLQVADRRILIKIRNLVRLHSLISKTRILNHHSVSDRILRRIRTLKGATPDVIFDFNRHKFIKKREAGYDVTK